MEDSFFALVALPIALAVIMTSLGLALTPADFRRVAEYPRGVAIGLTNVLLISPLLAFVVAEAYSLEAGLAVGLVVLGASPGGITANLLTHLARGDTALSVTMTAISSVVAIATVPLFLGLSIDFFGADGFDESVNMAGVVARVLVITVIPLSLGMYLRQRYPERVIAIEPRVRLISFGIFLAVVIGVIVAEHQRVLDNLDELAAATITLNLVAMALSYTIARLSRLDDRQATAIALELGIHNATLAIAVAATVATVLTIPAAVYSAFMYISAGAFAKLMHARNARLDEPGATWPATASAAEDAGASPR